MKAVLVFIALYFSFSHAQAQFYGRYFNTGSSKTISDFTFTSDKGYILTITQFSGDCQIIKLDSNFNVSWCKEMGLFGYPTDVKPQVLECVSGGYLFYSEYGGGSSGLVKLDNSGDFVWGVREMCPVGLWSYSPSYVNELPSGEIIMFRSVYGSMNYTKLNSTGSVLWAKSMAEDSAGAGKNPGFDYTILNDGSLVGSGKTTTDPCFARLDQSGNQLWNRIYKLTPTSIYPQAMAGMEDGHVLAGGLGSSGGTIMKLDSADGSILWKKNIPAQKVDLIKSVGGNKYLLFGGSEPSGFDMLSIVDGNGNMIQSLRLTIPYSRNSLAKIKTFGVNNYLMYSAYDSSSNNMFIVMKIDNSLDTNCVTENIVITSNATSLTATPYGNLDMTNETCFTNLSSVFITPSTFSFSQEEICLGMSVEEPIDFDVEIFPSPVIQNTSLTISIKKSSTYKFVVTDLNGKSYDSFNRSGNSFQYSIGKLSRGLYIVRIIDMNSGSILNKKIIVE